jgi:hypothetical protein
MWRDRSSSVPWSVARFCISAVDVTAESNHPRAHSAILTVGRAVSLQGDEELLREKQGPRRQERRLCEDSKGQGPPSGGDQASGVPRALRPRQQPQRALGTPSRQWDQELLEGRPERSRPHHRHQASSAGGHVAQEHQDQRELGPEARVGRPLIKRTDFPATHSLHSRAAA